MAAMVSAMADGQHLALEAGTGLGKTICALTAAKQQSGGRVIYATRTNSQQIQVLREQRILAAGADEAGLLPLMGRSHYCPLLKDDEKFAGATSDELGRLCRKAKRAATIEHETGKGQTGACPYYAGLLRDGPEPVQALLAGGAGGDELARRVTEAGSCPYEAIKLLLPSAPGVVLPLIFLLDDGLRGALAQWMGSALDECHVIVDEAHHLPDAARSHHSPALGTATLLRATKEARELGDPAVAPNLSASAILDAITAMIHHLADQCVGQDASGVSVRAAPSPGRQPSNRDGASEADIAPSAPPPRDYGQEEALLPPGLVAQELMHRLGVSSPAIGRIAAALQDAGAIIRQRREDQGRLPRSYLGAVGDFLAFWFQSSELPYAHLIRAGARPQLQACLLDAAPVLSWLHECASTTHMSGTLAPLAHYVQACGLPPTTRVATHGSPFPPANLRIVGVEGVHRRWQAHQDDPTHAERLQAACRGAIERLPGRTAIFFPSHQTMEDYLEEGLLHGVPRTLYKESQSMDHSTLTRLLTDFLDEGTGDAILAGVMGGRLTEGIDLPGDALSNVIIMGIPYPRPSARHEALMRQVERTGQSAWEVTVHAPVARTLRQTIGRLIRGPTDRGTAVILDERAVRFRRELPGLVMVSDVSMLDAHRPAWNRLEKDAEALGFALASAKRG